MLYKEKKKSSGNVQDLCQVTRYLRMSSNPTGCFLIKIFLHSLFGYVYFHVLFYYFLRIVCLFVLIFCVFFVVLYCFFVCMF